VVRIPSRPLFSLSVSEDGSALYGFATDETSGADPGDATEATPTDVSEADPVDVSETTSDAAVEPAGRNAPSDPLGDRSEDD